MKRKKSAALILISLSGCDAGEDFLFNNLDARNIYRKIRNGYIEGTDSLNPNPAPGGAGDRVSLPHIG